MAKIEEEMGAKFGSTTNPLLVSCRSGARDSMPGMMDTVLNIGLNDQTVEALAKQSGNERFAWDSYRRFVQMYGDVVLDMKPKTKNDHDPFEELLDAKKKKAGVHERLRADGRAAQGAGRRVQEGDQGRHRQGFSQRADGAGLGRHRRRVRQLDERPGHRLSPHVRHSARMGHGRQRAGDGLRQPGRRLRHRRGHDPRRGARHARPQRRLPDQCPGRRRRGRHSHAASGSKRRWPRTCPTAIDELVEIGKKLEAHYKDVQDIEFTIQRGKVWMLQTRNAKRTGFAAVRIAVDLVNEGLITKEDALQRQADSGRRSEPALAADLRSRSRRRRP